MIDKPKRPFGAHRAGKLVLEFYWNGDAGTRPADGRYRVRLAASVDADAGADAGRWRVRNRPDSVVSRVMFMVALQNVQHLLIRATDSMDRTQATYVHNLT